MNRHLNDNVFGDIIPAGTKSHVISGLFDRRSEQSLKRSGRSRLRSFFPILISSVLIATFGQSVRATDDDYERIEEIWASAVTITDTILEHHIDAPSRQEMLLRATKAVYRISESPIPASLSEDFSGAPSNAHLQELVIEALVHASNQSIDDEMVQAVFFEGLLSPVNGAINLTSQSDYNVRKSLAENRYVGIGIMLATEGSWPKIVKPFPGGPAKNGGAIAEDLIVSIDGVSTDGMPLAEVVDRLRGPLDTQVDVELRTGDDESRIVEMIRSEVPIASVEGRRIDDDDVWHFELGEGDLYERYGHVAYVKIREIKGSTAQELRETSRRIRSEGFDEVLIDMRGVVSGDMHQTVMVADALLPGGVIGQLKSREQTQTIHARDEAVFEGMPMTILINEQLTANVVWLCAALQDNHRATIVGPEVAANGYRFEEFELEGERGVLTFVATGYYLRGDGTLLSSLRIIGEPSQQHLTTGNVRRPLSPVLTPDVVQADQPDVSMDPLLQRALETHLSELGNQGIDSGEPESPGEANE